MENMTSMLLCEECGSHNIIKDQYLVCRDCGAVIEEPVLGTEYRPLINLEKGARVTFQDSPYTTGTLIGLPQERKGYFRKLEKIQRKSYENDVLMAYRCYKELLNHFEISFSIEHLISVFRKLYPKISPRTKGKNIRFFTATIFLRLLQESTVNVKLTEILDFVGMSKRDYFDILDYISAADHKFIINSRALNNPNLIKQIITSAALDFNMSYKVIEFAFFIATKLRNSIGYTPKVIAATSLYLANSKYNGNKVKAYKIAKRIGISISSIHTNIKKVSSEKLESIVKRFESSRKANERSGEMSSRSRLPSDAITDELEKCRRLVHKRNERYREILESKYKRHEGNEESSHVIMSHIRTSSSLSKPVSES